MCSLRTCKVSEPGFGLLASRAVPTAMGKQLKASACSWESIALSHCGQPQRQTSIAPVWSAEGSCGEATMLSGMGACPTVRKAGHTSMWGRPCQRAGQATVNPAGRQAS